MKLIEKKLEEVLSRAPPAPPPVGAPMERAPAPPGGRPTTGLDAGLVKAQNVQVDDIDDEVDKLLKVAQEAKRAPGGVKRKAEEGSKRKSFGELPVDKARDHEKDAKARRKKAGQETPVVTG